MMFGLGLLTGLVIALFNILLFRTKVVDKVIEKVKEVSYKNKMATIIDTTNPIEGLGKIK